MPREKERGRISRAASERASETEGRKESLRIFLLRVGNLSLSLSLSFFLLDVGNDVIAKSVHCESASYGQTSKSWSNRVGDWDFSEVYVRACVACLFPFKGK